MMGKQKGRQPKLFYSDINIEERVSGRHLLRRIQQRIDFDFIYKEVQESYGTNGNVSIAPPVTLKLMLLLVLYNVRSERELIDTLPVRLDWLWFLGFDLDSTVPNHSVLSKARARWGVETFQRFFERIVSQCVQAGLVDGKKLFVDASLIDADASNNSVIKRGSLKKYLRKGYRKLEARLDDVVEDKKGETNSKLISTTDPDAAVTRHSIGKPKLRYKTHRGVEGKEEVITATKVTAGSVDDGDMLSEMIDIHEQNTGHKIDTAVADSRYGSKNNYLMCTDRNIKAHINNLEKTQRGSGRQEGIFAKEDFIYNPSTDVFICPAGNELRKRNFHKKRQNYEYIAPKGACARCHLRAQCTRAKTGRTLKRHIRQDDLDKMLSAAESSAAKQDLKTRQHLSERSFARSTRYGYKRARWRRLWRVQIQDYLIAALQNIQVLIKGSGTRVAKAAESACGGSNPLSLGRLLVISLLWSVENRTKRKNCQLGLSPSC